MIQQKFINYRYFSNSNSNNRLVDLFNREHNYLRMSLTEKCNFRCTYCMPLDGVKLSEKSKLLTLNERKRLIKIFSSSSLSSSSSSSSSSSIVQGFGFKKIRFTGGEPLLCENELIELIKYCKSLSYDTIAITTNGYKLNKLLPSLIDAGLNSINISLDTLQEDKFQNITRRPGRIVNKVLASIFHAASYKHVKVKVNCVVKRGFNDDEIQDFVKYFMNNIDDHNKSNNIDVRFIEFMPFQGNKWNRNELVSYDEMVDILKHQIQPYEYQYDNDNNYNKNPENFDKNDTTKWFYTKKNCKMRIGFITSMTKHFCQTCNRLRITADGKLRLCLFGKDGLNFIEFLRNDEITNQDIIIKITDSMLLKRKSLGGLGTSTTTSNNNNNNNNNLSNSSKDNKKKNNDKKDNLDKLGQKLLSRPMVLIGG